MADATMGFDFDPRTDSRSNRACPGDVSANDEALLDGLRTGCEESYEALISRFQQPVYNLVYRLLNDSSETCDVVQEVFLKVFRNVGSFRGQSSLKTWIYRIAVNEAHNHRRWFCRHRKHEVGIDADEETGKGQVTLPDTGSSPFRAAWSREQHSLIEEALSQLNPIFRSAVVLRDVDELSYEEIAEVLQVSLGTVKSRILRGREALRKALAGRLEPGPVFEWTSHSGRVELGSVKP